MVANEELAEVFVEIADTLVDDFDVIEFLGLLAERAAQLSGSSAGGLVLADPQGRLRFVAASPESVDLLQLFELQSQEGPCLECYRSGSPTAAADLGTPEARERWPAFAERAVALGLQSSSAFPLRYRQTVIGALNVCSAEPGTLAEPEAKVVQALADAATIGLLQERTIRAGEALSNQLQDALVSRVSIEQAKGALARALDVDVDQAFTMLRAYARANNHRLSELARGVVADPARFPDLTRPHATGR